MRKFFLQNSLGQKWNLNDINSFFHTVKGLGQGYDTAYTQIGNRFLKKKDNLSQKKITGKVRFKGYEEFGEFSRFIQHKPLTLFYGGLETGIYPPFYPGNREYLLDVTVTALEKAELETGGLQSKITFESLGTYYRLLRIDGGESIESSIGDMRSVQIEIDSDTVLASGVRIEIAGPCRYPEYVHYIDGSFVCSGRFLCEIVSGNKMVIDTTKLPYEVAEYSADGEFVRDLYGTSDFLTKRFLTLGYGSNEIRFAGGGTGNLVVSVEVKMEYESV